MSRLTILLFLLIGFRGLTQELSHRQYTVKDGLPGSVVYHTLQDSKGFIWFATNQGVSRFDGRTFKNFSKEDGLPDNEILKLYLDRHNNIWFISFAGIPSVLYKEKIYSFSACQGVFAVVEDFISDSIYFVSHFNFAPIITGGVYKSVNKPGLWVFEKKVNPSNPLAFLQKPALKKSSEKKINFYFSLADEANYELMIRDSTSSTRRFRFRHKKDDVYMLLYNSRSQFSLSPDKESIVFCTDSLYLANKNGLRAFMSLDQLKLQANDLSYTYLENDSTLWLCTRQRGLIKIENFSLPGHRIYYYFTKAFCTAIIKDRESGYWITTHSDGVYYVPDAGSLFLPVSADDNGKEVKTIRSVDRQTIIIGAANGSITLLKTDSFTSIPFDRWNQSNKNNRVLDIMPYGKDRFIIASDYGIYMLSVADKGKRVSLMDGAKSVCLTSDTTLFVADAAGVNRGNIITNTFTRFFLKRATSIAQAGHIVYWGTLGGLYALTDDKIINCGQQYPALSGMINQVNIAPDSAIWVSTQQGIVILKNQHTTVIGKKEGLLSDLCKHVLFENNTAWVSTDKGISSINYRWDNDNIIYSIADVTENDGLLSNDVNQCAISGNQVWAATALGISVFPKIRTSHVSLPPLINITRIVTGNQEVMPGEPATIDYRENKLLIELSGISFRSGASIRYAYRIKDIDTNWSMTTTNRLEFSTLPPGAHIFEVRAIDRWGAGSEETKQFHFTVIPPFWKTSWFIFSLLLFAMFLAVLIIYLFYRNRQRKLRLEKKMYESEIMALKAQMNPHFIFNCLSSIQHYILRADTRNANLYLHKFSMLIRNILEFSSASDISLEEELKLLDGYLELENLRMGDRMQYQINMGETIRPAAIRIPSMIIQPYVENAIRHGISPLQDRPGIITISFTLSGNYLVCTIEDNGIGIAASMEAKENSQPAHQSMGTGITDSRINIINAVQKDKMHLKVINKKLPEQGTIIQIFFLIQSD
jgi:ligand-binding sensor domain-containing protein